MTKKNKLIIVATIVAALVLFAIIFFWLNKTPIKSINSNLQTINQAQLNTNQPPKNINTNTAPTNTTVNKTPTNTNTTSVVAYPISDFLAHATKNFFGTYYPVGGHDHPDLAVCPTAKYYSGYHTGLDLEAFSTEQNTAVPVYAVANGTVRQVGPVTGYGTLIIIEFTVSGTTYTAYYGHINGATVTVKAGDAVTKGGKLAELGPACSSMNGDVRKHLHFSLHKGTNIDVRGYAPNQTTLNTWVDPKQFFTDQGLK